MTTEAAKRPPRPESRDPDIERAPRTDAAPPAERPDRWSRQEVAVVAFLAALTAGLGLWALGSNSFWVDEGATWAISGHSFDALTSALRSSGGDGAAALYYVLAHGWMSVFGTSETALRSMSVIAAIATIPPFYAIARRMMRGSLALVTTALLVTSPFFIDHAREGRAYALALLLVVAASLAFLRACEAQTPGSWSIYTLVAALAIYSHWFATLVIAAHFLSLLGADRSRLRIRPILFSGLALIALAAPIAVLVLVGKTSGVDWVAPLNWTQVRAVGTAFTGTASWPVQLGFVVLVGTGTITTIRGLATTRPGPDCQMRLLALAWLFVPLALAVLVSIVKPVLVDRYLIVALPGFVLLVGLGIGRLARDRRSALALGVIIILLGVPRLGHELTHGQGEPWRGVVAAVSDYASPGDAVVVYPASAVFPFSYYARDDRLLAPRGGTTWPPVPWNHPFDRSAPAISALAQVTRLKPPEVWLVVRAPKSGVVRSGVANPPALERLRRGLERSYPVVTQVIPRGGDAVVVLTRYAR